MRDDAWLQNRFEQIWSLFFPEVENKNVFICWKGKWKNKFGHIKDAKNGLTEIAINSLFKDLRVPEDMIKLTIAHEIVHYSHGFHSHLPKLFKHPHEGGIVDKVLIEKGFKYAIKKEKEWFKKEWQALFKELCPNRKLRVRRVQQRNLFRFF
tara:strand:+ start:37 stop:492 length:456 start_codon:yes stop_codon:yes gene_type:complete